MMMNDQDHPYTEWDAQVARRIACAVISYQAGVSYESLWEQYANPNEDMGTFWLAIAKQVRENLPQKPK